MITKQIYSCQFIGYLTKQGVPCVQDATTNCQLKIAG